MPVTVMAQSAKKSSSVTIDYSQPKKYILGGITVTGIKSVRAENILSMTGLTNGTEITIPGDDISSVVKRLWMQRAFSDVALSIDSVRKDTVFLQLHLEERPRVVRWDFTGIKSGEKSELQDRLKLRRGSELSDYLIKASSDIIKRYYVEKGFLNTEITVSQVDDTTIANAVNVTFNVDRKKKVKIKKITFEGNKNISDFTLAMSMKKTKDKRLINFFNSKKFKEVEFENDKKSLISKYNERGYRDAKIVKDSTYYITPNRLGIDLKIDEGKKYYFRNITWTGNSVYSKEVLNSVLRIGKGDIYDVVSMKNRLYESQDGNISKLYRDNGYLFFNITPVEINVEGDSVDVEMRMVEGKPATYNKIILNGNTITHEKIVRRELYIRPGYLYDQNLMERSIRELSSMGHFDPEKLMVYGQGYNLVPNQNDNTVDVIFNVEEKPNSQLEVAGGWGGNTFVGTLGVSFSNFSIKRVFDKKAWRPVPLGDGQQMALRFQTNGTYYTALSANFTEPWLFGTKPTSLSVSAYYTRQTNAYYFYQTADQSMEVFGLSAGIGTRLKWPDNLFVLYNELSAQTYKLTNWQYYFLFSNGYSNNINWKIRLSRNSTDQQIYPRRGSDIQLGLALTPPYSLFRPKDTDYESMSDAKRYKWIEYHKWTAKGSLFVPVTQDLVIMARANFGYLGYYNRKLGYSPFEGFVLGGDGMSGYNTYGTETIGLRGYSNNSLTPRINGAYAGNVYDKFTLELRYPLVMQSQSTIYALMFLEGGNAWSDIRDFNPFQIKRSAGVGVRVLLPIVGMLGIDWGYGFDPVPYENKSRGGSNFHFLIGQQF
jgi:outer membrane protein insertion porin family